MLRDRVLPYASGGLVILAGLVSASCGSQSLGPGGGPGGPASAIVTGFVLAGPSCPVATPTRSCGARPLSGVMVEAMVGAAAASVAPGSARSQTRTRPDGSFALALQAGTYHLEVKSSDTFPRCQPVTVTVAAGAHRHLDIHCDTGIR